MTRIFNRILFIILIFVHVLLTLVHGEVYFGASCSSYLLGKRTATRQPVSSIDHPDHSLFTRPMDCGDDAMIVYDTPNVTYFGVADGIGGFHKYKTDPSFLAWYVMAQLRDVVKEHLESSSTIETLDLQTILTRIFLEKKNTNLKGATTIMIAALQKSSLSMSIATIGDASCVILRDGHVEKLFHQDNKKFNTPNAVAYSFGNQRVMLSNAMYDQIQLQKDDVIVMATDGLFDNLHPEEVAEIVAKNTPSKFLQTIDINSCMDVAKALTQSATYIGRRTFIYTKLRKRMLDASLSGELERALDGFRGDAHNEKEKEESSWMVVDHISPEEKVNDKNADQDQEDMKIGQASRKWSWKSVLSSMSESSFISFSGQQANEPKPFENKYKEVDDYAILVNPYCANMEWAQISSLNLRTRPFYEEQRKYGHAAQNLGKPDDITVIVGYVV